MKGLPSNSWYCHAKYKYCKNSKHFAKQFHGNGRQLYQSKQQIDGTEKRIDSMMNKENPATAGAVFDSDHTLVPSHDIRITNNIEKTKQIKSKLSSGLMVTLKIRTANFSVL